MNIKHRYICHMDVGQYVGSIIVNIHKLNANDTIHTSTMMAQLAQVLENSYFELRTLTSISSF